MATRDIERMSPDKLVAGFSRSRIMAGVFLSIIVHLVVLGATSIDYLHGVVDPDWKIEQERKRQAELDAKKVQELKERLEAAPAPAAPAAGATEGSTTGEEGAKTEGDRGEQKEMSEQERMMKERGDSKIIKTITETASPDELPKEPDLGISIEDTNLE
jgi:hypothetical protein